MRLVMGGESLQGPLTGIGQYTYHLAREMIACPEIHELMFLVHGRLRKPETLMLERSCDQKSSSDETDRPKNLNLMLGRARSVLARNKAAVAIYESLMSQLERHALRHYGSRDLFHSPNYMLPRFPGRQIVSILDLSTYRFPQYHPEARVRFVNGHIQRAVNHADHIITISNQVKAEVIERFKYPAENISVTYLGAEEAFRPITPEDFQKVVQSPKLLYKGYFLFVSSIEPRKNLDRLLDAYLVYRESTRADALPLIVAGIPGWKSQKLHARLQQLNRDGVLHYLGYVAQELMPALVAGATALLYPSVYEGFGLPVLEAMQSGTAVLTSSGTAMAEIGGECVMAADPSDTQAMATAMVTLAGDQQLRSLLECNGVDRAKKFSWKNCAADTLAAYQATMN